jgi:PAS domain S-box-containing protein
MIANEVFFRKASEALDGLAVGSDSGGIVRIFNRTAQEVTGYRAEEVLGKPWVEVFVPDDYKPPVRDILDSVLQGKTLSRHGCYPIRCKDGREILMHWDRSLIRNEKGDVEGIFSIGCNLIQHGSPGEGDLETRGILESMADGVLIMDRDLRIIYFNRAAAVMTGFKKEEILGRHCRDVFRTCLSTDHCFLRESMETGKSFVNIDSHVLSKDDEKISVTVSSAAYRDLEGNVIGGIQVLRRLSGFAELPEDRQNGYSYHGIVGKSKALKEIFDLLPQIARGKSTVLITGETGTGKELVARAVHELSSRSSKPLVEVNCSAIPETLLESELFGYRKGAFTDAKQDKPGRFEMAEGGTILLDEIGSASLAAQAKLLRVLETKEYEPLGAKSTKKADVRIICATNKKLCSLVESGKFMEDLFYRITVVPIDIPPLRERAEDVPLLISHFLDSFNRTEGRNVVGFTQSALTILLNYEYPGNVRELKSIVECAFNLSKSSHIGPESLRFPSKGEGAVAGPVKGKETIREMEKKLILRSLKEHNGSVNAAAEALGIHRVTLWKKMKNRTATNHVAILLVQLITSILPLICPLEVAFC